MKLVDILARELRVWPDDWVVCSQDSDSYIAGYSDASLMRFSNGDWVGMDNFISGDWVLSKHDRGLSSDYPTAIVTRAEWQAAVDALNAPKVVELEIDWSKQPEGFPLWLEGTNKDHRNHSGWYRENGEVFTGEDGGLWRSCREGQFFTVHRKPETSTPEWDGVSIPYAGDSLEYKTTDAGEYWCKAIVKFVGTHFILVGYQHPDLGLSEAGIYHAMLDGNFSGLLRKIRTAEQVAAEEREKEIADMMEVTSDGITCMDRDDALALYKAGYRKQVAK